MPSSMSQRNRKVDKSIIEQSAFLDTDDQNDIITSLTEENLATYKKYFRYLELFYLFQVAVMLLYHEPAPLVCLLMVKSSLSYRSTVFETEWANWLWKRVDYFNALLCLYTLWKWTGNSSRMHLLLPSINLATLAMFRHWHHNMENDVNGLNKLVYKYKSV